MAWPRPAANVADARPRRALTAAEVDRAAVLVANRDTPALPAVERTVAVGAERVVTFALGRVE